MIVSPVRGIYARIIGRVTPRNGCSNRFPRRDDGVFPDRNPLYASRPPA
jgi:hypothetical protein